MPLLYIYIFQFIAEKVGKFDQEINPRLILEGWHRHIYHIPRFYDSFLLEEMQYLGLIKKDKKECSNYIFYGSLIDNVINKLGEGALETSKKIESPLLYLYVFSKMVSLFGSKNQLVTSRQLISVWRKHIPNVPRIYDVHILTEMCNYNFIRRIDSQKYIFYGGKSAVKLKRINELRLW